MAPSSTLWGVKTLLRYLTTLNPYKAIRSSAQPFPHPSCDLSEKNKNCARLDQTALTYNGFRCAFIFVASTSTSRGGEEPDPTKPATVTGPEGWKSSSHVNNLLFLSCLHSQQSFAMTSLRRLSVLTRHLRPPKSTTSSASSTFSSSAAASPTFPTLPLAGIRVLDMTRVLAGVRYSSADKNSGADAQQPYCTQLLGDLG